MPEHVFLLYTGAEGIYVKTKVFFVRHAQSDKTDPRERERSLTEQGWRDCDKVTQALADVKIDALFSSPYQRAEKACGRCSGGIWRLCGVF